MFPLFSTAPVSIASSVLDNPQVIEGRKWAITRKKQSPWIGQTTCYSPRVFLVFPAGHLPTPTLFWPEPVMLSIAVASWAGVSLPMLSAPHCELF